jgi:hypothetical protein
MVAESAFPAELAGPLDPQAAREIDTAAAVTAIAAVRNVSFTICNSIRPPGSTLIARLLVSGVRPSGSEAALPLNMLDPNLRNISIIFSVR